MDFTSNSTPMKKPKLLRSVPTQSNNFVFIDNTTNEPVDASSISLLVVDDATLSTYQKKAGLPVEEEQSFKEPAIPKNKGGKYSYFTHRDSANYLGLKSAIKRVFNNFKFADNKLKNQLKELSRIKEQKQAEEEQDVFELPSKYSQVQAEKDDVTVPIDYDEVIDLAQTMVQPTKPTPYVPPVVAPQPQVVQPEPESVSLQEIESVFGVNTAPKVAPQPQVNYANVTSKYSDGPEVDESDGFAIETNLNISQEEAKQKEKAHEESLKTVINDETNPIPDVHLDLEKLDKDLVIFDKPKASEVIGQVEPETIVMPEGQSTPFAPKDNSVFTPEFNDEYLSGSEEEYQKVHGDERRSVSIMNTETGEKQVLVDLSKEGGDPNGASLEGEGAEALADMQSEGAIDLEREIVETGAYQREIVKGKKTYKLKKYKQDIIPEDIKSGRGVAWLAYILFFLPLLFKGRNTYVRHHANEGLELNIMEIVAAGLIAPFVLVQQGMLVAETEMMLQVFMIMAVVGVFLAFALVLCMVFSILFAMCGFTSSLPFFWGFRFIKVAKHKR